MSEWFDLVDQAGRYVGKATREECHHNTELLHPVVHILVFNEQGDLYLQRRAVTKDIQPGRWDTSVGGHLLLEEPIEQAGLREAAEELGVTLSSLEPLWSYIWKSSRESELVCTFRSVHNGPFELDPGEIDEGRFWKLEEIKTNIADDIFTPNFVHEFERLLEQREPVCPRSGKAG